MMASAVGITLSAVQRIWQAHHLQPHPQPFVWTKPADNNLAKLRRLPVTAD
jgi:hypothetical protein